MGRGAGGARHREVKRNRNRACASDLPIPVLGELPEIAGSCGLAGGHGSGGGLPAVGKYLCRSGELNSDWGFSAEFSTRTTDREGFLSEFRTDFTCEPLQ